MVCEAESDPIRLELLCCNVIKVVVTCVLESGTVITVPSVRSTNVIEAGPPFGRYERISLVCFQSESINGELDHMHLLTN